MKEFIQFNDLFEFAVIPKKCIRIAVWLLYEFMLLKGGFAF